MKRFAKNIRNHGDQILSVEEPNFENRIRLYIDLIDSLRALGVGKDISLPAICVIGDQSSGKSSVLEALSGVCLPKDTGMVTRCPLELKLKKNTKNKDWNATISYGNVKESVSNPSSVEQAVKEAQDKFICEDEISDALITLEIVSPNVPDLTLIDLPGIIRTPLRNQSKEIVEQIKLINKKYLKKQEIIILAVVPCNADIATTGALEMVQEVDPTGNRTIGILTKPDLIDSGSEQQILRTVRNLVYPLSKGYMIVKCRGQNEIKENISLEDSLKKEKKFFDTHQHFSTLEKCGMATVPMLADRLTKELVAHIIRTLPDLKQQIKTKLRKAKDELEKIGRGLPDSDDSDDDNIQFLVKIIIDFTNAISWLVNVNPESNDEHLILCKKLREIFEHWDKFMENSVSQFVKELKEKTKDSKDWLRGWELPGYFNYINYENILRSQILSFQEQAIMTLHKVSELVKQCFENEEANWFEKYTNLHHAALDKIKDLSHEQEHQAKNTIELQFQMEGAIYCQDTIFYKATERSEISVTEIICDAQNYLAITTTRLSNQIPLIIIHFILKEYAKKLQNQMILLIQNKQKKYLPDETDELSRQRNKLKKDIKCLSMIQERLKGDPFLTVSTQN